MRAAVLTKNDSKLKILNKISLPDLKRGQLLVKLKYSGICHSQLMEIDGKRGKDKWLPHLLGHEGSGIVIDKHKSVKRFSKGSSVILSWIKGKGIEAGGSTYFHNQIGNINGGPVTTFNEYTIVSENRLSPKPKNLNFKEAILFGCAIPTGFGLVLNEAKPKKNSIISVLGLGGIGISALIACKCLNPKKLIAIDINNKKLSYVKKFGVEILLNPQDKDFEYKYLKATEGKGSDYIFESAGKSKTIEIAFNLINDSGSVYFASHPNFSDKIRLDPFDLIKGKKIFGSWGGAYNPSTDLKKFLKIIRKNNINLNTLIPKTYKLNKINTAIKDLKKGKIIRAVLDLR